MTGVLRIDSISAIIIVMRISFVWIKRNDGTSEFTDFMSSLAIKDRAKLYALISTIEEQGMEIAKKMQWVKKLRDGIFEIRSRQGTDIQRTLYFHEVGTQYVITHGFSKKTDAVPENEIEHAKKLRDDYIKKVIHNEHYR